MSATYANGHASTSASDGLIRFGWNEPVEVSLKYATGKLVEGKFGNSMLFSTTDDRRFFVPVEVGDEIGRLGIHPGEPITITKRESRDGARKGAAFEIRLARPVAPPVATPAAAPAPAPTVGGSAPPPSLREFVTELYRAAIDILVEAEEYAKDRGFEVEFNAEDIRALAATLLIERRKEATWPLS